MAEQDGRGSLSKKSKSVLYLPQGQRTYNRVMSSIERPSGAASESRTLEGVHGGIRESWSQAGGSTKREPSPASSMPCRGVRIQLE